MSKPHITIKNFDVATTEKFFTQSLGAIGGDPPYSWTATGLPPGLRVNFDNVQGTPTKGGTYSVTIKVQDMAKQTASTTLSLVVESLLTITTTSLPPAVQGQAYTATVSALGGTTPYTFTASGLPSGLTISPGGVISGTPNSSGTFSATITVTDNS